MEEFATQIVCLAASVVSLATAVVKALIMARTDHRKDEESRNH